MKLLALLALALPMFGQTTIALTSTAVSIQVGTSFPLTDNLNSDGRAVASYVDDIVATFQPTGGTSAPITLILNSASSVPGKSANCNPANNRCLEIGYLPPSLNSTLLSNGPTLTRVLTVPQGTPAGKLTINVANVFGADPTGTTGTSGILMSAGAALVVNVTIPKVLGDLNADGAVDFLDVGLANDQILGKTPCTTADLDGDGKCLPKDAQIIIHATGN